MKYTLTICHQYLPHLLKEGLDVKVIRHSGAMVQIELTLSCNLDLLKVFYAGVEAGVDKGANNYYLPATKLK